MLHNVQIYPINQLLLFVSYTISIVQINLTFCVHSCTIIILSLVCNCTHRIASFSCDSCSPRVSFPKPNIFIQFCDFRQRATQKYIKLLIEVHPCLTSYFHHPWAITTWWPRLQSLKELEEHATRERKVNGWRTLWVPSVWQKFLRKEFWRQGE